MLPVISDLKTVVKILRPPKGKEHVDRLESFYSGQADDYDEFRKKLLPGRLETIQFLNDHPGGVWADIGCGTGINLEYFGEKKLSQFSKIYMVDLSPSLLEVTKSRVKKWHLSQAKICQEDACEFQAQEPLDLVTFSYSLTMIPHWYKAIDNALQCLKPGGTIAVTDFYVAEKYPVDNLVCHSSWTRHFWQLWFSWDNVFLSPDHLPYLMENFEKVYVREGRHSLPYMPVGKVPYYIFVGRKAKV